MPVAQKVKIKHKGMTPEELIKEFSHLTLPQVYDALSYFYDNREEIDKELSLNESDLKVQVKAC